MEDGLRADDGEMIIPEITITPTPKITADRSKFTREYVIELEKFGIFKDGTHAAETSKGINAALQHAKTVDANRIIFPPGTYLIDEKDPVILDHQNTIIDLNGATLQIQTNGMPDYRVISIVNGAKNLRLTNGTLVGDRDTHDYKTVPGSHEWGAGISFDSGEGLEIDHLTMKDFAGDGVSTSTSGHRNRPELLSMIFFSMYKKHLEQGAFSETGEKVPSTQKTRTIEPVDLSKAKGEFALGFMGGYAGFPFIKGRVYQVYFLDADGKFLEKRKVLQFRTLKMPEGTKFAHFEFNQPEVSDVPAHAGAAKGSWLVRITAFKPPRDVHFHHNTLSRNRRLGMAFTGGQRWVIEENLFEKNRGTNPASGVDFEDGAELMHDIVFRKNSFNDNGNSDLVICAGTEILVEDNVFQKSVVMWGRPHNYTFRNNRFNGGSVIYATRTGIASIHNNFYTNCKVSIRFDTKAVADGIVRAVGEKVSTPPLRFENETMEDVTSVQGTYLNFKNSTFKNTQLIANDQTHMVDLQGCTFENSTLDFQKKGPNVTFIFKNNKGELPIVGEGQTRKLAINP